MLITLLGAESTGKSSLAHALALHFNAQGLRTGKVDEYLRQWCSKAQRTPRVDEQLAIAKEQTDQIQLACALHTVVVADTCALMTAVYSDYVFGDTSLYAQALASLKGTDSILLMGLDIAWQADGLQRDGAHVRPAVDAMVRKALTGAGLAFSTVYGLGPVRLQHALQAIKTTKLIANYDHNTVTLAKHTAKVQPAWKWLCDKCSDPVCEHQLFSQLIEERRGQASAPQHR